MYQVYYYRSTSGGSGCRDVATISVRYSVSLFPLPWMKSVSHACTHSIFRPVHFPGTNFHHMMTPGFPLPPRPFQAQEKKNEGAGI